MKARLIFSARIRSLPFFLCPEFRNGRLIVRTLMLATIVYAGFSAPAGVEKRVRRGDDSADKGSPAFVNELGLKETRIETFQVFYSPALESDLPVIKKQFAELSIGLRKGKEQGETLRTKGEEIIREINALVGGMPNEDFL